MYTLFVTDALHMKACSIHLAIMELLVDYIEHKSQVNTNDSRGKHCVNAFAKVLDTMTRRESYYRFLWIPKKGMLGAVKAYTSYEWSVLMKAIGPLMGAVDWIDLFSSQRANGDDNITSREVDLLFASSPEEQAKLRELATAPPDKLSSKPKRT